MPIPGSGQRSAYVASLYALELDGAMAGWLSSADGGYASADVVVGTGPDQIMHKHLGNVKYEDITLTCGTAMATGFYDWLKGVMNHAPQPKNGAIIGADNNSKEASRLEFYNALITEIGFPALDANSKDPAYLTIKISPEYTRRKKASGQAVGRSGLDQSRRNNWMCANFRLQIEGLDCTHVNRIDALAIRQHLLEHSVGQTRAPDKTPTYLDVPNLVVTLAEASAGSFYDWHEDFVINGHSGQDKEKNGTLDFLSPDLRVILSLALKNLGIFRMSPDKFETSSQNIRRVSAEMYCDEMGFSHTGAASRQSDRLPRELIPPLSPPAELNGSARVSLLGPAYRFRA